MNAWTLVRRSLIFHWRSHLGLLLGTAIASTVLCGALAVGSSVRETLLARARHRTVGSVAAIQQTDRFFRQDLATRLTGTNGGALGEVRTVAVLGLPATVRRQDNQASANRIQIIGVRGLEWHQYLRHIGQADFNPVGQQIWFNRTLAARLNAKLGDTFIVRIHKPTALSQDAVIVPRNEGSVALRLGFAGILNPETGGDISFQAGQSTALNAFVNLDELAKAAQLEGRANWLLASDPSPGRDATLARLESQLHQVWQLDDAELSLRTSKLGDPQPAVELCSRRIFLDREVAAIGFRISGAVPILTYLANGIGTQGRLAPYSMVTAAGAPYTPTDLHDDEIVLNDWLSTDLGAKAGDSVELAYYQVDAGSQLLERTNRFRVRSVVPMTGLYGDKTLMPEFPGLAKAESTHDWDAGFELVHTIRDKDEAYWKKWRGTPKAFITLNAGSNLWANRFGNLTAIRWPASPGSATNRVNEIRNELRKQLTPSVLGLSFQPTGDPAIASATGGQDFGQLFLGFSFFLILSALALVSLLFRLALINRADELGILLATGWPIRRLRGLILRETLVVALPGVVLGALAGILYGQGIIIALNTIWRGAVAGTGLEFHASVLDLAIGAVSSLAIVILTVWFLIRGAAKRPARELLNEGLRESLPTHLRPLQTWRRALPTVVSVLGLLMLAASFAVSESERPGLCFGAGFFLLIGLLWGFRQRMAKVPKSEGIPSFASLAARAPIRNPSRSMTTAGLLASAAFMVVAIGANKLDATRNATQRNSGTGGFALWAESALPVIQDLNTTKGLDFYTLDHSKVGGMNVVPMKVREGDEASCLNLNRALRPRILGVNPQILAQRHAFTLTDTLSGEPESRDWAKLLPPGKAGATVRGVVDANSLEWSLHKKVGDTIDYVDESGRPFQVLVVGAIANSILQGSVVIAESDFIQRFPNESGYRTFLIDAPAAQQQTIAAELTRGLSDLGFEALTTTTRLAAFNAVENTYLNTFQILGGLGLLLGSAGLGIVVMRNVAERRSEFGVLRALGFQLGAIRRMVLIEHAALLVIGLGIGAVSALIAVLPALLSPGPETDWLSLVITMVAILICGLACTWFGTRIAVTGQVTEALRGE